MVKNLKDTIRNVAGELIGVLNVRNRDVILRRFGLKKGNKETLESIGQNYNITRERVRQIEDAAIALIKKSRFGKRGEKRQRLEKRSRHFLKSIKKRDFFKRGSYLHA